MIFGIGTDIIKISRIQATMERHPQRFVEKILGKDEQLIYHQRAAQSQRRALLFLATRFAAKEAFSKAIGLGVRHPMNWHSLQVLSADLGRPQLYWYGELAAWMSSKNLSAHLSVSDEDEFAIAYVVVEQHTSVNDACMSSSVGKSGGHHE
ncbi:holo-ACP synthase [Undibacterium amnicola]|uniref:Holo-[acyl-carrier-protein] synthase n=1 Tax=Undibacterium amnicola TaxID=1834038 RepID=A0ABR6XP42_9BURK|nr:holo-ACP synthase [Undibacterium amnicola]MBC3830739.1 holo-ACP synthase [Undibacterium amnicola]